MCSLDFAGSLKHDERRTTCLVIQFKQNDLKYENSPCLFLAFRRKLLVMLFRILKKCTFLVVHVKFICLLDMFEALNSAVHELGPSWCIIQPEVQVLSTIWLNVDVEHLLLGSYN